MRLCLSFHAITTIPISVVSAFGTVNDPNILGQNNEHEMITRLAFQCAPRTKSDGFCFEEHSLKQLAGYHFNYNGFPIAGAGFNGAVGAPDTFDPAPEGPEAHCDNADFIDIPGYPRTREEATQALQECVDHLRRRFLQAQKAAEQLLDDRKRIRQDMVDFDGILRGNCYFAFPGFQLHDLWGRAKCHTIEGLGRALHGVQDFYAHSNWVDRTDESELPIGALNPPGLERNDTAPFLDLRRRGAIPPEEVPKNLSTGCFVVPDETPGSRTCQERVTHHTLCKDRGIIHLDGSFGDVGEEQPRSERYRDNFERAVALAVRDSRNVWAALQDELRGHYGQASGDLMICALVRDNPLHDCLNRTVAIAIDKSAAAGGPLRGPVVIERQIAATLNSRLAGDWSADKVTMIEFDNDARVVYPAGDPGSAALGGLETKGQANIGDALELAINDVIEAQPETYTDRGAVLLLTVGKESRDSLGKMLEQLHRAVDEGIRVHYGCMSAPPPPQLEHFSSPDQRPWADVSPGVEVMSAALRTGGVFAFVNPNTLRLKNDQTPAAFVDLVMSRGLTVTDHADVTDDIPIAPGIVIAEDLHPGTVKKSFVYNARAGETVEFIVHERFPSGYEKPERIERCFNVTLKDKLLSAGHPIAQYSTCDFDEDESTTIDGDTGTHHATSGYDAYPDNTKAQTIITKRTKKRLFPDNHLTYSLITPARLVLVAEYSQPHQCCDGDDEPPERYRMPGQWPDPAEETGGRDLRGEIIFTVELRVRPSY